MQDNGDSGKRWRESKLRVFESLQKCFGSGGGGSGDGRGGRGGGEDGRECRGNERLSL